MGNHVHKESVVLKLEDRSSGNGMAEIIDRYLDDYLKSHKISHHQEKVLDAIRRCRTASLGGHLQECDRCNYRQIAYNSCRNRHCCKCQANRRIEWLKTQQKDLLPIPYYHLVITLPHALNDLCLCNQREMYELFFNCASKSLQTFAADPRYLGGKMGMIGILHTWGQNLSYHVHLHFIVTGGGLSEDGGEWKRLPYRKSFIFPVKAVSKMMQGMMIRGLKALYSEGRLKFPGQLSVLAEAGYFYDWANSLWKEAFYSYAKKPVGGSEDSFEYIAEYSNKIAISNKRIKCIADGNILFRYRDYRDNSRQKMMKLSSDEFLRRFLCHILPYGFRKIRYYGILARGCRRKYLAIIRQLLAENIENTVNDDSAGKGADYIPCPECEVGALRMLSYLKAVQLKRIIAFRQQQLNLSFDSS